ncbi:BrnA antitoxin family protein [Breoghania sp. L-A4]|uniref:BrnA antitoxin family protein n=1 Tax=Breoghania sp. L-A4 TaxID=2304600 RepID=UPI000E35E2FC|nr:BrnA antitoxin family protein [Breoghania sp. L-A4]AXS40050.1 3-oxoacyl-ACP synthase [Breoghania sp. L-A4]
MKKRYNAELSLEELAALPDEQIDHSDIPELDDAFFEAAKLTRPATKRQVTIRFDADVLDWFKAQGKGYQSRMNAILRAYMQSKQQR